MSYLSVKESKGVQKGFLIVTAIEKHQSIMVPLVLPEAGAVWERLHELHPFAWTCPTASDLVLKEARAVQVHASLPAGKQSPRHVNCTALHK